jgi:hypothetical protein
MKNPFRLSVIAFLAAIMISITCGADGQSHHLQRVQSVRDKPRQHAPARRNPLRALALQPEWVR